ncbi:MAG: xanthine dehydrogenase family protein molybdopterin-binding subunit, partial [Burkholderiales bacterium]
MAQQPAGYARIGEPVQRKEDARLVTGAGCFSDDVNLDGQVYAIMLRSPHAHARFRVSEVSKARAAPGIVAVLTAQDLLADGIKPIPHRPFSPHPADIPLENTDGTPMFMAPHFPLAIDKVRHVGEAVAMVIAETVAAAKDGAELVEVDYELLPAVANTAAAARPDAPRVFDEARSNVCLDAETGDAAATATAFARAAHVVRFETWIPRVTGVPMEPRAAVGEYDASTGHYTLHAGTSGAWRTKMDLAIMLGVAEEAVRVITRDVGGHFGTRGMLYGEFALVLWGARRVGRPVKWTCERHEAFATDYQGRDLVVNAELALDAQGSFLAMRGTNVSNAGGPTTHVSPLRKGVESMSSIYRGPAAHFRAVGVVSNTAP